MMASARPGLIRKAQRCNSSEMGPDVKNTTIFARTCLSLL